MMLNPGQIAAQVHDLEENRLSVQEFESWFRRESRNFHAYPDESARAAIFEIEAILSEYHFDGLDEASVPKELAAALRPFEELAELSWVYPPGLQNGVSSNKPGDEKKSDDSAPRTNAWYLSPNPLVRQVAA